MRILMGVSNSIILKLYGSMLMFNLGLTELPGGHQAQYN